MKATVHDVQLCSQKVICDMMDDGCEKDNGQAYSG